jgi:hypothetical protein
MMKTFYILGLAALALLLMPALHAQRGEVDLTPELRAFDWETSVDSAFKRAADEDKLVFMFAWRGGG